MPTLVELCLLHDFYIQIQQTITCRRKPMKSFTLQNGLKPLKRYILHFLEEAKIDFFSKQMLLIFDLAFVVQLAGVRKGQHVKISKNNKSGSGERNCQKKPNN